MEEHEVIRPNFIYAGITQFLTFLIYIVIGVVCFKILEFFMGFDIIPMVLDTLRMIDADSVDMIFELFGDLIETVIYLILPMVFILINIINQKVEVKQDKIIVKSGFIKIKKEEYLINEIVRYEAEKDLGFLPAGTFEIFTRYGDKIVLNYVLNLNKASRYLDEVIAMNKKAFAEHEHKIAKMNAVAQKPLS